MSEFRIASRYARSLLTLADEHKVLEDVHADLQLFSKTCKENHALVLLLKNPIITHDKKLGVLNALFKGKVNKLTLSFFEIITRKRREAFLPPMAAEFHHQYNVFKKIQTAFIHTATPLTEDLRSEMHKIIVRTIGQEVELEEKVDKDLIGGFVLKVGDKQFDTSLQSKLRELKMNFTEKHYQRVKDQT